MKSERVIEVPKIAIVYHSGYGHTAQVAAALLHTLQHLGAATDFLTAEDAIRQMDLLHETDTLVFGSPTYFGSVSAAFKKFMEATGSFWYRQLWKDKLAAGFTNSSSAGGDKLNTLQSLSLFAAQHGMIWISQGILPRFLNDQQTDGQNRLGCYLGLMTHSDNSLTSVSDIHPGDLLTTELFAKRIFDITIQFKTKSSFYDTTGN